MDLNQHVSVCDAMAKLPCGSLWDDQKLLCLVLGEFGDDFMVSHRRKWPYGNKFICDADEDIQLITNATEFALTDWWIFGASLKMKIEILNCINLPFVLTYRARKQLRHMLKHNWSYLFEDSGKHNIIRHICNFLYGDEPVLQVADLYKKELKHLIISDQCGGIVTCGICVNCKFNRILRLNDWNFVWWMEHINTEKHQLNAQQ